MLKKELGIQCVQDEQRKKNQLGGAVSMISPRKDDK